MSSYSVKKVSTLALLTSAVFAVSSLAPIEFAPGPFSPDAAFAKSENANDGNRGGNGGGRSGDRGGNRGDNGGDRGGNKGGDKSTAKSNNGGGKGGGKGVGGLFSKATQKGGNLVNKVFGRDKAKAKAQKSTTPQGKPKAIVRQYVLANGLKQGEISSMLKSWNSLNRNPQAYLNNMDNLNSLPGKQIDYVRSSLAATAAEENFLALGGVLDSPPTDEGLTAATTTLGDAQALEDAAIAAGYTSYQDYQDKVLANPTLADTTIDGMAATAPTDTEIAEAEAYVAQHEAYHGEGGVVETEGAAQDFFMEASVSYSGDYDEATMGELREHVDAIIDMKELDTLVSDYDAAAAAAEAEAAAAEGDVVLLDGDGEAFALVVE